MSIFDSNPTPELQDRFNEVCANLAAGKNYQQRLYTIFNDHDLWVDIDISNPRRLLQVVESKCFDEIFRVKK